MSLWFEWQDAPSGDFAVIGDPIAHSLSPKMHTAAYAALGMDTTYHAVRVPARDFVPALDRMRALGYTGVNVTVPLKELAASWCDSERDGTGVVNTLNLVKGTGVNTDLPGFQETVTDLGLESGRALVLGAGGSARSVVIGLSRLGWDIALFNRTHTRATALVEACAVPVQLLSEPSPAGCSLIVNTTSAGLSGESPDVTWNELEEGSVAYDLMYGNEPTEFLCQATAHGARGVDGRALLVAQGALSFEWWTGLPAPRDAMLQVVA